VKCSTAEERWVQIRGSLISVRATLFTACVAQVFGTGPQTPVSSPLQFVCTGARDRGVIQEVEASTSMRM